LVVPVNVALVFSLISPVIQKVSKYNQKSIAFKPLYSLIQPTMSVAASRNERVDYPPKTKKTLRTTV